MLYSGAYKKSGFPLQLLVPWIVFLGLGLISFWATIRSFLTLYTAGYRPLRPSNLQDIINDLYNRTARDPKDMAFGMWAILQTRAPFRLPKPDYQQPQAAIYQTFTQLLVQITKSPQLLLYAAIKNVPGGPSWVPDWAAKGNQTWGDGEAILSDNSTWLRNEAGDWYDRLLPFATGDAAISFKPGMNNLVLTVRARRALDVTRCFYFQESALGESNDAQSQIHVHNMRLMLLLMQSHRKNSDVPGSTKVRSTWPKFPRDLVDTFDTAAFDVDLSILESISSSRLNLWSKFLHKHQSDDPLQVLTLLRGGGHNLKQRAEYKDILGTHVSFCNYLARQEKMIFQGSPLGDPTQFRAGLCSRKVEAGHQVMEIMGVPSRLIVCPRPGEQDAIRLISPAIIKHMCSWSSKDYSDIDRIDLGVNQLVDIH